MSNEDWLGMDSEATAAINSAPQRPINRAEDARIIDEGVQPLQNGGLIDQSWRNRNVRAVEGEGADIMYRNTLRENERTLTVMERIAEITEDGDINPFTGKRAAITRAGMARIAGKGGNMDEGFDEEEEEPRGRSRVDEDEGDDFIKPIQARSGSWTVIDMMAKSASSGAQIPVWKVQDEDRGVEIPHTFRLEEAATMACEYLNMGKKDKAKTMMEMDQRRFDLAKQARVLKESNKAGYKKVMSEIAQINIKLGL